MAISTFKTYLMKGATSGGSTTYTKLLDIVSFPDLGGDPDPIETTTLSDPMQTFIAGILSNGNMSFEANYTHADYAIVTALANQEVELAVWFGATESAGVYTPTGSEGKFAFKGNIGAYVTGGGVNEVVKMNVVVTPTTVITDQTT